MTVYKQVERILIICEKTIDNILRIKPILSAMLLFIRS